MPKLNWQSQNLELALQITVEDLKLMTERVIIEDIVLRVKGKIHRCFKCEQEDHIKKKNSPLPEDKERIVETLVQTVTKVLKPETGLGSTSEEVPRKRKRNRKFEVEVVNTMSLSKPNVTSPTLHAPHPPSSTRKPEKNTATQEPIELI